MSAAKKPEPVEWLTTEWLTTGEAAKLLLNTTTETVRGYVERGYLPETRRAPGGQYRIARSDVDALLARWKVKG